MLDMSIDAWTAQLPSPGRHGATIADLSVFEKDTAVFLNPIYALEAGQRIVEFLCIDADPKSGAFGRVAQGRGRLLRICEATGVSPTFSSADDIVAALLGAQLIIVLAHTMKDGLPVPVVRAVMARS